MAYHNKSFVIETKLFSGPLEFQMHGMMSSSTPAYHIRSSLESTLPATSKQFPRRVEKISLGTFSIYGMVYHLPAFGLHPKGWCCQRQKNTDPTPGAGVM